MINGVGDSKTGRLGASGIGLERASAAAKAGDSRLQDRISAPTSPAAAMAAAGAPVDIDKVAAIRAAIAEGRYPVDADKIAARMIALDLKPGA